jgi:hypothetical protein
MKSIAFLFLTCFCLSAGAVDFEMDVGSAHYDKKADGYWYQEGFQNSLQLTPTAVEIGVTGDLWRRRSYGLAYHIDWVYLGAVRTQAMATPDDANYDVSTKKCNGKCLPLANFVGSGHDQGFLFSVEPYVVVDGWRLGAEIGPYLHKPLFSEVVYNWQPNPNAPQQTVYARNMNRWVWSSMYGLSIGHNNFTLSYQYFSNDGVKNDPSSTIWKHTHLLSLKYKF